MHVCVSVGRGDHNYILVSNISKAQTFIIGIRYCYNQLLLSVHTSLLVCEILFLVSYNIKMLFVSCLFHLLLCIHCRLHMFCPSWFAILIHAFILVENNLSVFCTFLALWQTLINCDYIYLRWWKLWISKYS